MKPLRYTGRYWTAQEIEKAKLRAAAICRYLRQAHEPNYTPNPTTVCRLRLENINLPKRKRT